MVAYIMDIKRLSKLLVTYSRTNGLIFTLRGNQITPEEVFSPIGLLPGIAKRAEQIAYLCFGQKLAVSFPEKENTTLKYTIELEDSDHILTLFCIFDVLLEIIKKAPKQNKIPLDELLY